MPDHIRMAIALYRVFSNWREVAKRIFHPSGMPWTADGLARAVRNFDKRTA